jgi:hypothetical protein
MAAASYYLLVVNAPTPVVHERMVESATSAFNAVLQTLRSFLNIPDNEADLESRRWLE